MATPDQLDDAFAAGIRAATLRNPIQEWLRDAFTGDTGDSGVAVNYNSSLTYSSVFSAVSMIAGDIAGLPLNVQRVNGDGDKETANSHPAQWLLNDEPNSVMDSLTFRETLQSHALMWGNGYAAITRDNVARPVGMIPLMPDRTKPMIVDGRLIYETRDEDNNEPIRMMPSEVLHIKGLGWDGLQGHSVIALARRGWGLGMAQEKHGARSFKNNAAPSITLETDARLTETEADALLERWKSKQGGDNALSPALLTGGVHVKPFSMSNEDAQWLESRKFQRVEVAAWFNLPPHKLGDDSRLSYNSIEAENRDYLNRTLRRWLKKWESECQRKLIADRVRRSRTVCIIHDTEDLLSADIETKVDVLVKLRTAEVVSRNEIRRKLGMPSTGPEGDDYKNPNTRSPEQTASEGQQPDTSEAESAMQDAMRATMKALIAGEANRVKNAAKTAKDFVGWCDNFYQTYSGKVAESMEPLIVAYTALPGVECHWTGAAVAESYAKASKDELLAAAGISYGKEELCVHVTEAVADWPARAAEIAKQICEVSYVPGE